MLSVTLRQLEYATAIASHGGMTPAAAALNVSQPALSVALAQLESLLGQPLFLRRAGRMTPTSFGEAWLAQAARHLQGLHHLMQGTTPDAPVRLAIFDDLAPALLAPLIARLAQTGPTIAPQILGFEPLATALTTGAIDLAVTWDLGLPPGITRQELARIAPHALLPPDHPLATHPTLTLSQLSDQPLILTDQGLSLGHMRGLFAARGLSATIAHRTATLELMRSFAANGLGIGLSYTRPANHHSHDGRPLVTRPLTDAGTEPLVLAHLQANPLSPAATRLQKILPSLLPPL
jgi:DNA-binding transcriptional LysR family regulator